MRPLTLKTIQRCQEKKQGMANHVDNIEAINGKDARSPPVKLYVKLVYIPAGFSLVYVLEVGKLIVPFTWKRECPRMV